MPVIVAVGGILPSTTLAAGIDSGPDLSGRINATPVTRLERDRAARRQGAGPARQMLSRLKGLAK
jgi:hypothetical protein